MAENFNPQDSFSIRGAKNQYKNDFFKKLAFPFEKGKKILDVGCGDGTDALIFIKEYGLKSYGIDIYEHENIKRFKLNFKPGSIKQIPYDPESFDYAFTHDVFHHVDGKRQRGEELIKALGELRRVCKRGGYIIIVEGNRYNPLFYPHMVLIGRHNHFRQSYFKKIINKVFGKDDVRFQFFEAHLYPKGLIFLFKIYEYLMERFSPKQFLAYNAAIIKKQ